MSAHVIRGEMPYTIEDKTQDDYVPYVIELIVEYTIRVEPMTKEYPGSLEIDINKIMDIHGETDEFSEGDEYMIEMEEKEIKKAIKAREEEAIAEVSLQWR